MKECVKDECHDHKCINISEEGKYTKHGKISNEWEVADMYILKDRSSIKANQLALILFAQLLYFIEYCFVKTLKTVYISDTCL